MCVYPVTWILGLTCVYKPLTKLELVHETNSMH